MGWQKARCVSSDTMFLRVVKGGARDHGRLCRAIKRFSGFTRGAQFGSGGVLANDDLTGAKFRGAGNVFNSVNIGLLIGHGVQGDRPDLNSGALIETYYPIYAVGESQYDWVRAHEFQFGGDLRWMGISACNMAGTTAVPNWTSHGSWPFQTDKLHLMLAASTSVYMYSSFGTNWAWAMTGKLKGVPSKQSVRLYGSSRDIRLRA
jgi:hypothetical protein